MIDVNYRNRKYGSGERFKVKDKIVIVGGGGHAKVIINIIKKLNNYEILGYVDLIDRGLLLGVRYLGTDAVLLNIIEEHKYCKAVIGIGNTVISNKRYEIYKVLKEIGFELPVIISKNAIVNEEVRIDEGSVLLDSVIINVCSSIGKCVIVNTGAIVEHDCEIGDFSHIASGVVLSGGVRVNSNSMVGSGATILHDKEIGENCLIGSGAVVTKNCLEPGTYIGIPAIRINY